MTSEVRTEERTRTHAAVRRSRWPGWIWAIPIAAILLVGWWLARTFLTNSQDISITFNDVHGLKEGDSKVVYRGMKVGKVTGMELAKDGKTVEVKVNIEDRATAMLRSGTRFWLRGAEPSLANPASLSSVLSGPTIVMEPGPGGRTTHFAGLAHKPVVADADNHPQAYRVLLNGAVGELKEGGPVKLRGFTVGEVKYIGFRYDPDTGAIATPVTLTLYPSLLHIEANGSSDARTALRGAIDRMVREGLRARLERTPPLIGSPEVELDLVSGSSQATPTLVDGIPEIPAAPGGGLTDIVDRINKLPIDQIAANVSEITRHVDRIVSSPKLDDIVSQLDATLQQIHGTADAAGPQITALIDLLRKTAVQLDHAVTAVQSTAETTRETAKSVDRLVGGATSQDGMRTTLREVKEAARSVRELADFLDRRPESLVRGRSGE
jgi:paraquat-inducible protein B